ncbi:hypothetical protein NMG60_11013927 [Bertholletia excelsa]
MKKGKGKNSGLLPNSFRIISSCLKTVSANASTVVRSAGASVAASISASADDRRDQVTWAGFDKLEIGPNGFKHVLLLGYQNGFQVFDVEDASNFSELVSKHDGPVTFLQMLPIPVKSDNGEGFRSSYPLLLVVAGDQPSSLNLGHTSSHSGGLNRDGAVESQSMNNMNSPTAVSFYSFRSNSFVKVLKFRSAVCMVRCSSRIVAVGLPTQIYCIDALTLENKFSVLTYPVPQFGAQGTVGINFGYGPMAVGPRWLAYASNNPLVLNTGRLSPKNLTPSPGVSPSTSPSSGSLMARYAVESSKHLATGIINLSDTGCKKLSRYCLDLLPDGASSPVPLGSGRRVGRVAASEMENAGVVVVKDCISRAVISQFRAHTSPLSALSFDPSGTLLVTASVHGNNINVFRIMPSCTHNESGEHIYDWSSAHVHLYKLHRGIRPAIIQDICFSHYSQWIGIISNKGTCHIYVLSPFGGDAGFEALNFHSEDATPYPVLSLPWWSTSSFIMNQHFSPPPPAVFLSVVTRIKDSNSGLLNSVTNAAASAAGKATAPSGVVTAAFHNSMSRGVCDFQLKTKSMEHLLVYTPSGHVVQYELLPLVGMDLGNSALRNPSGSFAHTQEEEFGVKVEPVQWWDVCRKADWPEREEPFSGTTFDRKEDAEIKQMVKCDSVKFQEKHLSNAEVQINSGRLPVWQKSKICFHVMSIPSVEGHEGGELEIEQCPFREVEIKRKDLLPVFDNFHGIKASWNDRVLGETYPNASSLGIHRVRDKSTEETVICHSNPASVSSTESSSGGSSRRIENLLDLEQMSAEKSTTPITEIMNMLNQEIRVPANFESSLMKQRPLAIVSLPMEQSNDNGSHIDDTINGLSLVDSDTPPGRSAIITKAAVPSDACRIANDPILTVDPFHSAMQISTEGSTPSRQKNLAVSEAFIQEGYCKGLDMELDGCCGLAEDVTDDMNCSKELHEPVNPGEDVENDDFLAGMFSFSE